MTKFLAYLKNFCVSEVVIVDYRMISLFSYLCDTKTDIRSQDVIWSRGLTSSAILQIYQEILLSDPIYWQAFL